MEDEKVKKYLNDMKKIIQSGNPKYMTYVSREYMKYKKISPMLAETIGDIIFKDVNKNEKSPYAIFLHDNGSICIDAMSDISKIYNVTEFIKQVEKLSEYEFDFGEITADDLILEGDEIAEEIAKDLEKEDMTETELNNIEEKADKSLKKVGILAVLGGTATAVLTKLKEKISGLKIKKKELPKIEMQKKEEKEKNEFENFCPKVNIDHQKVIQQMQEKSKDNSRKKEDMDTYGDGDPDGDDLEI